MTMSLRNFRRIASGESPNVASWKRGTIARRSSRSPTVTVRLPTCATIFARRACSSGVPLVGSAARGLPLVAKSDAMTMRASPRQRMQGFYPPGRQGRQEERQREILLSPLLGGLAVKKFAS